MVKGKKELKVLMVTPRYFPFIGGIETHVYEVGWRLAQAGVQVSVLTTDISEKLPPVEESRGVQVLRVPAWPSNRDYYFAPAIYRMITQGQWDIVHCQGYHTMVAPLAMFAAWHAGLPYVVTFHSGGDISIFRRKFRNVQHMLLRPLLAHAKKLIGPSRWEVEFFRERLHLPGERFVVVPNGASHLPDLAGEPANAKQGKLIVSVGRLERYKGHQRVIAAMPFVLQKFPDAHLCIVGKGSYEAELRALVRKLGVDTVVKIQAVPPGDARGVATLMAQADLVTLLSEHEAQGIAVLEALSLKRPVLVANTTALQEFAERGLARSIPINSTPRAVAAAMIDQLQNPLQVGRIALPTWDECASQLYLLYSSLREDDKIS